MRSTDTTPTASKNAAAIENERLNFALLVTTVNSIRMVPTIKEGKREFCAARYPDGYHAAVKLYGPATFRSTRNCVNAQCSCGDSWIRPRSGPLAPALRTTPWAEPGPTRLERPRPLDWRFPFGGSAGEKSCSPGIVRLPHYVLGRARNKCRNVL